MRFSVLKFGGTSVSSATHWNTICGQVLTAVAAGRRVMVVVSAISGVTAALQRLCDAQGGERDQLLKEIRRRHLELMGGLGLGISRLAIDVGVTAHDALGLSYHASLIYRLPPPRLEGLP